MKSQLTPPVGPRDHVMGPAEAPLTLVEYGDFECPYCGMAYPIVKAVQRHFGEQLRFAFRHFPLSQVHPHAEHAAEMAEIAGAKDAFWPMHDMLYENQHALSDEDLVGYASELGIDVQWAVSMLASHAFVDRVREDFASGVRSGVNGTPSFFINGVRHDGPWDAPSLVETLEQVLHTSVR